MTRRSALVRFTQVAALIAPVAAVATLLTAAVTDPGRLLIVFAAIGFVGLSCAVGGLVALSTSEQTRCRTVDASPALVIATGDRAPTPKITPAEPPKKAVAQPRQRPSTVLQIEGQDVPEEVWKWRRSEVPSFRYKLHESQRRQKLLPMVGHRQRVWKYNSKPDGYEFAASHGIPIPESHIDQSTMKEVDWADLPTRFAIKPTHGTANRGIFLLVSDGNNFRDLMDGRGKSASDVCDAYTALVGKGLISEQFIVEELLEPRADLDGTVDIPDDLKIYCFYDEPSLIMQRRTRGSSNHEEWRFKFWDADWRDLGPVRNRRRLDRSLERPSGGDDVLDAARKLATALALPFIRLDIYDTQRGPVFGEVSPHPGPPEIWIPEMDELLGRRWEIAEARLLAAGISPAEERPS